MYFLLLLVVARLGIIISFYFAQGALVGVLSPGGGGACALVQGALVGAIGPEGIREVSGSAVDDAGPGLVVVHGAAVDPIGSVRLPAPGVAQGALVPESALGRAVGA